MCVKKNQWKCGLIHLHTLSVKMLEQSLSLSEQILLAAHLMELYILTQHMGQPQVYIIINVGKHVCIQHMIHYSLSAGTDFSSTSFEVSFTDSSYTTTVDVPIVDNSIGEREEVFYGILTITSTDNVAITQERADIHITDDDGMHVQCTYSTIGIIVIDIILQFVYGLSHHPTLLMKLLEQLLSLSEPILLEVHLMDQWRYIP